MLDSKDNVELRTRLAKLKMQDGDVDETNEEADADDEVIFFTALLSIYIFTYIPQQARAANLLNRRCVHNAPARRCKKCNGSDICDPQRCEPRVQGGGECGVMQARGHTVGVPPLLLSPLG